MHWIEQAYREHFGLASHQKVMNCKLLNALIAAEPKGVRRWTRPGWCGTASLFWREKSDGYPIPVEVREVEAEEPARATATDPNPVVLTGFVEPVHKPKTYTEEDLRLAQAVAWSAGQASGADWPNPYRASPIDPRALAAAKEWYPETPRGSYDKERGDLARIIAKHYEEKK